MKALDRAVRRHVADAVRRYCPGCLGTKSVYVRNADGSHTRKPCQRCELTGLRD